MWGQPCPCCWRCGVLRLLPFPCCVHLERASSRSLVPAQRAAESLHHCVPCEVSPSQEKPFRGWVALPGRCRAAGFERSSSPAQAPGKVAGDVLSQLSFLGLESMCVIIQEMGLVSRWWRQLNFLTQACCLAGKEPAMLCREKYRAWTGCGRVSSSSSSFLRGRCWCRTEAAATTRCALVGVVPCKDGPRASIQRYPSSFVPRVISGPLN